MVDMPIPVRAIDSDARGQPQSGLPEAALAVLAQEVIHRLARWTKDTAKQRSGAKKPKVQPDIDGLSAAFLGLDPEAAKRMILKAHRQGASHEELCLHHMVAAARSIGDRWEQNELSYRNMALAAGRILHLLREMRELAPPFDPRGARCALFATVPGETHVLGVTMAAGLFRDDGWDVDLRLDKTETEICDIVRAGGYPIVGLSAATSDRVGALGRAIVGLRLVAPKVLIFVSGNLARLEPDIAIRVGADGAASEMDQCKSHMERLHKMVPGVMRLN